MRLMGGTFSERKLSVHDLSIHVYGLGPSFIGISQPSSEKMALPLQPTPGKHSFIRKNKVHGGWSTSTIPECLLPQNVKVSERRNFFKKVLFGAGRAN